MNSNLRRCNLDVYEGVVDNMRLPGSNLLFGLPIVLDTACEAGAYTRPPFSST